MTTPPNEPYDPAKSATSKPVGQNYNSTYETCDPVHPLESCTISGPLYTDVVSLGGFGPVPIEIGVIGNQTSNFYQFQTVDGVMGMMGGPIQGNVFESLCVKYGKCDPVWGICMYPGMLSNGTITIGGVDLVFRYF